MKEKKPKKEKEEVDYSMKNEAIQRLMPFIEKKGKPSAIAKMIGLSDNIFSNMVKRDTKPSSEMLIGLATLFPELDIHYILTGTEAMVTGKLRDEVKKKEVALNKSEDLIATFTALSKKAKGTIYRPEERLTMLEKRSRIDVGRMTLSNMRRPAKKGVASGRVPQVAVKLLVAKYGTGIQQN